MVGRESPVPLGVDLDAHYLDVVRLVRWRHGKRCEHHGIDVDDLVSIVCRRILTANLGRSPYDPRRASLSRYIVLQSESALRNEVDKRRRRARHEVVGPEEDAAAMADRHPAGDR